MNNGSKVNPSAIKDIKVVETIKEGVTIYPVGPGVAKVPVAAAKDAGKTYA